MTDVRSPKRARIDGAVEITERLCPDMVFSFLQRQPDSEDDRRLLRFCMEFAKNDFARRRLFDAHGRHLGPAVGIDSHLLNRVLPREVMLLVFRHWVSFKDEIEQIRNCGAEVVYVQNAGSWRNLYVTRVTRDPGRLGGVKFESPPATLDVRYRQAECASHSVPRQCRALCFTNNDAADFVLLSAPLRRGASGKAQMQRDGSWVQATDADLGALVSFAPANRVELARIVQRLRERVEAPPTPPTPPAGVVAITEYFCPHQIYTFLRMSQAQYAKGHRTRAKREYQQLQISCLQLIEGRFRRRVTFDALTGAGRSQQHDVDDLLCALLPLEARVINVQRALTSVSFGSLVQHVVSRGAAVLYATKDIVAIACVTPKSDCVGGVAFRVPPADLHLTLSAHCNVTCKMNGFYRRWPQAPLPSCVQAICTSVDDAAACVLNRFNLRKAATGEVLVERKGIWVAGSDADLRNLIIDAGVHVVGAGMRLKTPNLRAAVRRLRDRVHQPFVDSSGHVFFADGVYHCAAARFTDYSDAAAASLQSRARLPCEFPEPAPAPAEPRALYTFLARGLAGEASGAIGLLAGAGADEFVATALQALGGYAAVAEAGKLPLGRGNRITFIRGRAHRQLTSTNVQTHCFVLVADRLPHGVRVPALKFVVDAAPDTDRLVPAVLAAYSGTPLERAVVADSDVARVVNFVGFQDDKPMHQQPMVTINALKERLPPAVSSQAIGKQLAELGAKPYYHNCANCRAECDHDPAKTGGIVPGRKYKVFLGVELK